MKTAKQTLQTLWKKDFSLMVAGQVVSLFGNAILRFALSLYVLDETGSAAAFGSMMAVSLLPTLLLSPVGGLLADRVSRQRMMVLLDFGTALLLLGFLAGMRAGGGVPLVGVLMVLLSVIAACYQPAVQASIPVLAAGERLEQANGIVIQVNALASLTGPILGGLFYGLCGFYPLLLASAGCFFRSAVMELFLHIPFTPPKRSKGILKTAAEDLGGAWQFLREKPAMIKLLLIFAGLNLTVSAMLTIGLPYTVRVFLGAGDALYGLSQAAPALGMIAGGILAGLLGSRLQFARSYVLLLAVAAALLPMGASLTGLLPVLPAYLLCVLPATVSLICCTLFNVAAQTYLQRQTPPGLLGRVAAFVSVLCQCAAPIGQAAYGLLFERLRAGWLVVLFTCAIGLLLALAARRLFARMEA